jgi:2-alkyl-3-oxoalkanoate reductase
VEAVWALRQAIGRPPAADHPPMTRFMAEQLSTAHWFDQRQTRELLAWRPAVTLDTGFRRLAASYSR